MLTDVQKERYARQLLEMSEEQQSSLLSKKVVQVGIGGLGSPLAYYLVAMGIGKLTIIEYDDISLSNLNRQIMYSTSEIGSFKGKISKDKLEALNSDVEIEVIEEKLTQKNYKKIIREADYLVDASDNAKTKFLVNDIGLDLNIPFTIAGVREMEGQIMSVVPHETACYRCVFGKVKPKGLVNNPPGPLGIYGFTAGVLGAMQAAEVIKGLLKMDGRLLNSMLMVDLLYMQFLNVKVSKNNNCIC
ncbi:MAG: HesA/MoeB/ThiF family protein [Promethearchaeota archaeon]|nr:MAG: HesA/MoeB/ThiF family protein [Candidatus Lokiarchaeota archaeon]